MPVEVMLLGFGSGLFGGLLGVAVGLLFRFAPRGKTEVVYRWGQRPA